MYRVTFYTYSGMSIPMLATEDRDELKGFVQRYLRRKRRLGYYVQYLGKRNNSPGASWEIADENAAMIGDDQGFLSVRKVRKSACRDCRA